MRIIVAASLLLLAACGSREPLERAPGQPAPPKPATAPRAETAEEQLELPPIVRPERVDEPLRRSEAREDDRFDLPPPE
ncbi:MAG TPA: hypothetical protein VGD10_08600 [Allosphingosinicella sp.]|uniref:hypothetical protein n=1 Tax=Allosphingosinicella sp. TaxID=2823234 RepID=UPI002EDA3409